MNTEKLDIEIKISLMNKFQEFLSTYTNLKNNLNKLFLNSNNLNINQYTSTLLFRLMALYFIQKKGFFNNDLDYLRTCLEISKQKGKNLYLSDAKIAHIYNLTETEFKYIIDTFTIVPQDHKNLSLEYFKEFAESK